MDAHTAAAVVVIGMSIGLLGGLFGKGGSAVATPLLHAAGVPPIAAVASPLPATVPGTLVAAREYWRAGLVDRRLVRWSVAAGFPATVIGAYSTRWIPGGGLVLATDVLIGVFGLRLLARAGPGEPTRVRRDSTALVVVLAVVIGALSGLLGSSGGFLLAPAFVTVLGRPLKEAFGSSLAVACALAVPGTAVHALLGHVDWLVTALFSSASIPLSRVGARLALATPAVRLERAYGAVLASLGLVFLTLAH
jgi:hypothetical protein